MKIIPNKKFLQLGLIIFLLANYSYAAENKQATIAMQLSAEQWLSANDAEVNIAIDTLNNPKTLTSIDSRLLKPLQTLTPQAKWHITDYDRQQDSSGLTRLKLICSARLPMAQLNKLQAKLSSISKSGRNYQVANIDYKPSNALIATMDQSLRTEIYKQVLVEINKANSAFKTTQFHLLRVNFTNQYFPIQALASQKVGFLKSNTASVSQQNYPVSQKITLKANVVITN